MTKELRLTLDHVGLSVVDLSRSRAFYAKLLAPLGMEVVVDLSADVAGVECTGFGIGRKGSFWIAESGLQTPATHYCFRARTRAEVRAFHEAGLAAGGVDNGPPGIREVYHPAYYAAFVLDPDGHNIEAVCFEPEHASGSRRGEEAREVEVRVDSVSPILVARDVAAALKRYEAMGFVANAYGHPDRAAPFYGFVCMGHTEFHVAGSDDLDPLTTTSALYLYVDDADAVYERWHGAVEGRFHPPQDTDYGLREFGYVDPDGNLFRVGSPTRSSPSDGDSAGLVDE